MQQKGFEYQLLSLLSSSSCSSKKCCSIACNSNYFCFSHRGREGVTSSSSVSSEFSPFPKLQESTWALQHYPQ